MNPRIGSRRGNAAGNAPHGSIAPKQLRLPQQRTTSVPTVDQMVRHGRHTVDMFCLTKKLPAGTGNEGEWEPCDKHFSGPSLPAMCSIPNIGCTPLRHPIANTALKLSLLSVQLLLLLQCVSLQLLDLQLRMADVKANMDAVI